MARECQKACSKLKKVEKKRAWYTVTTDYTDLSACCKLAASNLPAFS